ncbi:deoxyribonuclease IV [Candidatus Dojkabacteria bacterium]|uniref:Probable endonuclease 4 n=1 Tax=Candidatus Dojkabacteria bacterium TaxID=2099670 RepID=A0A955HXA6_9BACT|nr:deoxyribonuclease IV [Candidatus Dojkabacteria bacterium]MCB9791001.1 deoxyribonuclease IV [Candidatus Nomurabacteria bacterium]
MRYLGAHVSASGGLANSIKNGETLGVNSIQTMFSAPMRWALKEIPQEQIDEMAAAQKDSGVKKLLIHGIYLINLARKDKQMFHLSKMSLVSHLDALWRLEKAVNKIGGDLGILGLTFHPGSAKDLTPEEGVKRISYGLNWVLDKVEGGMLLLESSAGSGNIMGDTLEELRNMYDGVEDKGRVGYVLDTQHMFVSGYDWRNNLDDIVDQIDNVLGLENVKCFHLNDSMKPFDSHRDRHANLGEGEIGIDAIKAIVNHPRLSSIPFILETPALKTLDGSIEEMNRLKEIAV